jgi:hypothetical protein
MVERERERDIYIFTNSSRIIVLHRKRWVCRFAASSQ